MLRGSIAAGRTKNPERSTYLKNQRRKTRQQEHSACTRHPNPSNERNGEDAESTRDIDEGGGVRCHQRVSCVRRQSTIEVASVGRLRKLQLLLQ